MPLDFDVEMQQFADIKVIGVGGGGNNAINRMIEAGLKAWSLCVNTVPALFSFPKAKRNSVGKNLPGLGAGAYPDVGMKEAQRMREIIELCKG